jgi:hypothetical protein
MICPVEISGDNSEENWIKVCAACHATLHEEPRPNAANGLSFLLSDWSDPLNFMYRFSACDRNSESFSR